MKRNIESLQKRIAAMEQPDNNDDLIGRALDALTYEEVCLLEEAKHLNDAGFDESQVND
jgi:hypothetical protein